MKASGEPPKLSGGAFYLCSSTGRVYILAADDAWAMQGTPLSLLEELRRRAGKPGVPMPTDTAVRRLAGNAMTTGTSRFVARGLLIRRPCLWAAAVELNPSWAVEGGRPLVSVAETASPTERFGSSTSSTPTATKGGDAWKGGGRAYVGRRPIRHLLVGWFAVKFIHWFMADVYLLGVLSVSPPSAK